MLKKFICSLVHSFRKCWLAIILCGVKLGHCEDKHFGDWEFNLGISHMHREFLMTRDPHVNKSIWNKMMLKVFWELTDTLKANNFEGRQYTLVQQGTLALWLQSTLFLSKTCLYLAISHYKDHTSNFWPKYFLERELITVLPTGLMLNEASQPRHLFPRMGQSPSFTLSMSPMSYVALANEFISHFSFFAHNTRSWITWSTVCFSGPHFCYSMILKSTNHRYSNILRKPAF